MLQRFPIGIARVKADNTSENLLNKSKWNQANHMLFASIKRSY